MRLGGYRTSDASWVTLALYAALLLAFAVPSWIALSAIAGTFFGDDEELGHNLLFLLIWGSAALAIAVPTSLALVNLARRRSASRFALLGSSGLALIATLLALVNQGLFNFGSMDYGYTLESPNVRIVAGLFVLAAVVLVSVLMDARFRGRSR